MTIIMEGLVLSVVPGWPEESLMYQGSKHSMHTVFNVAPVQVEFPVFSISKLSNF